MLYEYGATGERTKLVYPDGRKVTYNYDEKLQLSSQLINTGTVDAEEARNATAAGIIGGAIGYGIGKVATKVAPKVLPKIASKVDDFASKVKALRNGGSVEAIRTEKPMFEYNLQFLQRVEKDVHLNNPNIQERDFTKMSVDIMCMLKRDLRGM